MERALLDRPPHHDPVYDGRPAVDDLVSNWRFGDDDPLLERLIRWHPEHIPPELIDQLAASRGRSF